MVDRAPVTRCPNRGGFHEGRSLFVGRVVSAVLFARHTRVARFDPSYWAVCRRIRFTRCSTYGSWLGHAMDTIWAVPANASDGAAHAARVTLLEQVEKGRQFLGEPPGTERAAPAESFLARDLVRVDCCRDFATERHSLNTCC